MPAKCAQLLKVIDSGDKPPTADALDMLLLQLAEGAASGKVRQWAGQLLTRGDTTGRVSPQQPRRRECHPRNPGSPVS